MVMADRIAKMGGMLVLALVLLFAFTSISDAAPKYEKRTLSLSAYYSPGHSEDPMYKSCVYFAELVKKYTNGQVVVSLSGEGQIYSSGTEMVKAAMMGALDIVWVPQSRHTIAGLKNWRIFSVPGLLTPGAGNEKFYGERLYKYFEDPAVFKIFSDEARSKGLMLFTIQADAPLILIAKKPYQPKDLKGIKLGSPGSLGYRLLGQRYGIAVVPLVATGERYSAIQQGMIDGILGTSKYLSMSYKWVELAPYAMSEPWSAVIHTLEISSATWDSLSNDLKALLKDKVIPEANAYCRKAFIENNKKLDRQYKAAGGEDYSWSQADVEALIAWYKEVVQQFRGEVDPKLLDMAVKYQ